MEWEPGLRVQGQGGEAAAETRRLIERAQRGDPEAFAELMRLHQRRVFSLISHLLRRPAEVEDIAQDVFLKVYRSLGRFDFRAAFSTWLHRIVVNECYDHMRRRRAQKSAAGKEVQVADPADWDRLLSAKSPEGPDAARRAELRQMVAQLFERLPAHDRLLLSLRELEGLTVEEIGALLKLKANTVKVQLFRARKRLLEIHRRSLARSRRKKQARG